jgi:hypothetical protein
VHREIDKKDKENALRKIVEDQNMRLKKLEEDVKRDLAE